MQKSVPRFAVIGAGIRGQSYAAAIQQHPRAELIAACDPAPAARAALAAATGVPVYDGTAALLSAHPEANAAIIATPDAHHVMPVTACLERGLDLLVEKPLATELAEAQRMTAAIRSAGVRSMIAFENRWNPKFQSVRTDLAEGGGSVINQVINLNDTVVVPTRMLSWAASSTPGWFLFPHSLDLATWLGRSQPVEVLARGVKQHLPSLGIDTWDAISAIFTMADGSLVTLNSQWVLPEAMPAVFDFRYELNATSAAYRIEISDSGVTRYGSGGVSAIHAPEWDSRGRQVGLISAMVNDFVDALEGADVDLPGVEHGFNITVAIDAAHRSLIDGRAHPISIGT